jgi:zinc D-Ala-D-Ala carboxypeptidase
VRTGVVIAAGLAVTAATTTALAAYTITNHGKNPLTPDAAKNLFYCKAWIDKVVTSLGGTLTSAYRSPRVNALVGGSPTSDHMKGLAADVKPGRLFTVESATEHVRMLARLGQIGPVRQVIWEPTWVHVGWYEPGRTGPTTALKKSGPKFEVIA